MPCPPDTTPTGSEEVALPVDDQTHLIARRSGVFPIEDRPARPEPHALEKRRHLERRTVVDREVILGLVGGRPLRDGIDRVYSPRDVHVRAETLGQEIREVRSEERRV